MQQYMKTITYHFHKQCVAWNNFEFDAMISLPLDLPLGRGIVSDFWVWDVRVHLKPHVLSGWSHPMVEPLGKFPLHSVEMTSNLYFCQRNDHCQIFHTIHPLGQGLIWDQITIIISNIHNGTCCLRTWSIQYDILILYYVLDVFWRRHPIGWGLSQK